MRLKYLLCASIAFFFIFSTLLFAQEEATEEAETAWYKDLSLNAFASVAYSYNFNKPDSGTNQFRVFDFDDNSFKIDVAELVVQKAISEPGEGGFRVDLTAGGSIPRITAASGLFRDDSGKAEDFDLQQAYVSYIFDAGNGLRLDAGKFVTHAGAELIEGYDGFNDNYSRSILFGYAIPFTHTGFKVGYSFNENVSAMVMVANGWDNVKDNNDAKTIGGQLTLIPHSTFTLYTNLLYGAEQTDNDDDSRSLIDLVGVWKPDPKIAVTVNFDYGSEENLAPNGDSATWTGFAGYFRYNFSDTCAFIVRGEVFDDADGARTGVAQTLTEFTLTPEFHLTDRMVLRGDLRFDHSDEDVFDDGGELSDSQTTIALNMLYAF